MKRFTVALIVLFFLFNGVLSAAPPASPTTQAIDAGQVEFEMRGDSYGPRSIDVVFDVPFEEAPIVVITPASDLTYRHRQGRPYTWAAVAETEEGFTIRFRRSEAFYNETIRINWIAVGQTAANFVDVGRPVEPASR